MEGDELEWTPAAVASRDQVEAALRDFLDQGSGTDAFRRALFSVLTDEVFSLALSPQEFIAVMRNRMREPLR